MKTSVIITSRNRPVELSRTLEKLKQLRPPPDEIIVTLDGVDADANDFVKKHPDIIWTINHMRLGSVRSRCMMIEKARGELAVMLDDDSYPEQTNFMELVVEYMDTHSNVAVLTFPQNTDEAIPRQKIMRPHGDDNVRSFANSGACLRISIYNQVDGFEPMFFHMYEEPDLAVRLIALGYEIKRFEVASIRHHYSGRERNEMRNHHLHARNEFWSTIMRCQFPHVLLLLMYRIVSQARFSKGRGLTWILSEPIWWAKALCGVYTAIKKRNVIRWDQYKKWLAMPD